MAQRLKAKARPLDPVVVVVAVLLMAARVETVSLLFGGNERSINA